MRRIEATWVAYLLVGASAVSCTSKNGSPHPTGATSFESQPPTGVSGTAGAPQGTAAGAATPSTAADAQQRAVVEPDIVQRAGSTLYVLNAYRGLQIIDVGDLAAPRLLGRVPVTGAPVDLYLKGTTALVTVSDDFRYVASADGTTAQLGSRLLAVDVSTPAQPSVLADLALDGQLEQSRLVGDVLYLVSRESVWNGGVMVAGGASGSGTAAGGTSTTSAGSGAAASGSGTATPGVVGGPAGGADTYSIASIDVADPAHPAAVDRLEFPATGWSTHANVTSDRVTLSFAGWDSGSNGYGPVTHFQVIDISDPAGKLVTGAAFTADGQVQDRWGMDFDSGTGLFRAVVGTGTTSGGAALQIWSSPTPGAAKVLSRLSLGVAESLTAARFDGTRVYVVTARQTDPLFAIDASDPTAPRLAGSLSMPGQLDFIEPRGDRLVALGHTSEAGQPFQLAVSLLDVTQLASPQLLSRVAFGSSWGWIPTSPDDVQKAFIVLDAPAAGGTGLVLVPVQGWDQRTYSYQGGTQLVDLGASDLVLRGFLQHPGAVKRSLPLDAAATQLVAFSDEALQTIDASDRDAPHELARIDLARSVTTLAIVGGAAVELSGDWYRGGMELAVTGALDPDAAAPLARVDVAAPAARLFQDGAITWLVASDWTTNAAWLQAIDVTDPAHPAPRGRLDLAPGGGLSSSPVRWGFGDEAVLAGHILALHQMSWGCAGCLGAVPLASGAATGAAPAGPGVIPGPSGSPANEVRLYDLSDPDQPRLVSTVELPTDAWSWGLQASGSNLWITHFEWESNASLGHYYLDAIDISDPSQPAVARINVPGIFFAATPDGQRVYTLETQWDQDRTTSWLHALDRIAPDTARLAASVALDGYPSGTAGSNGYAWVVTTAWSSSQQSSRLKTVDLRSMDVTYDEAVASAAWVKAATGGKLFLDASWYEPGVLVYDLSDPAHPAFEQSVRTQAWTWDVIVAGGYAYLPSGPYGVPMIPLAP